MMINYSLSRSTKLLIAANIILGMIVSAELLLPTRPGMANAAMKEDRRDSLPEFGDTSIVAPPIGQLAEMMERPLFFEDRRMPKPKVETAPPPPPTPLRLHLEGIAIAGGSRVAVLRNLHGTGLVQLAEGDSHDGWTLDALSSNSAIFSRNSGQTTELTLDPAGAKQ